VRWRHTAPSLTAIALAVAGCAVSGTRTLHPTPTSDSAGGGACDQCHPIDVGTHAAFIVGHFRIGSSGPGPVPSVPLISRDFAVTHRGDVLVSGVLTASNPSRTPSQLSLTSARWHGRYQTYARAQAVGAEIPAGGSVAIPFDFVYPDMPPGRDRFDVEASVLDAGLRIGPVSLVIQPLS
jgi:hypothetical protein